MKTQPIIVVLAMALAGSAVQCSEEAGMDPAYRARSQQREALRLRTLGAYPEAVSVLEQLSSDPDVRDLADEWPDILYALAANYAAQGRQADALSALSRAVEAGFAAYRELRDDSSFDSIRQAPRFQQLAGRLNRLQTFWENPVFNTPYRDTIPENERIAGLSRLWAEVKFNFANFGLVPDVNWDSLFVAYLPKVRRPQSTLEYYRTLQELCVHLRDGHTGVDVPDELRDLTQGRVPIQTRLTEGRVIVHEVFDPALRDLGVVPGLEITSIDGTPAREYARQQVLPLQAANTPQGLRRTVYEYALLRGPVDESVLLSFEGEDGQVFSQSLGRSSRIPGNGPLVAFEVLNGNVGYVSIRSFAWDEVVQAFDSIFPRVLRTDALIIDLRENGGGSGRIGWTILGYFTDRPLTYQKWISRAYSPIRRAWQRSEDWLERPPGMWPADRAHFYENPVVLLTRARTASMAENFCVGFRIMERGVIIGGPTAGSSGTPLFFSLPGGGEGRVVTTRGLYPDGTEYIGTGVQPDIEVVPTIEDVRAGRDAVLEAAIEYLGDAGVLDTRTPGTGRRNR